MGLIGLDGLPEGAKRDDDWYLEEESPVDFSISGVKIYMGKNISAAWNIRLKMIRGITLDQTDIIMWDILVEQYKRPIDKSIGGYNILPREVRFEAQAKYNTLRALLFDERI